MIGETQHDTELNTLAVRFLLDPNKRIRKSALRKLDSRKALDLVPDDYDADNQLHQP